MERPRLCVRPACGAPASVRLSYDYATRTAWIEDLGDDPAGGGLHLCGGHGSALRVPLGWALDDRRAPMIRLHPPLAG